MAGIMVPKSRAEAPASGGDNPFPSGAWEGTIEEIRVRGFPDFIGKALSEGATNRGYTSGEGEILGIQFGDNSPLEDQGDVGARKMFVDFVTRDGNASIEDANAIPESSWQMQKDAALLTNLALALGATEEVEFEGETYVETTPDFVDQLRNGDLKGTRIGFRVSHRNWTSKDKKKSGTEARVVEFFTLT